MYTFCFRKCWEKVSRVCMADHTKAFSSYEEYEKFINEHADEIATNLERERDAREQQIVSSDDEDEAQTGRWNWYIS